MKTEGSVFRTGGDLLACYELWLVSFPWRHLLIPLLFLTLSTFSFSQPRQFEIAPASRERLDLRVHSMDDYDFWTRERLFEYRRLRLLEYPKLARIFLPSLPAYEPDQEVFGQVESGKGWWGILGINYYGPGMKSIEGPSEESRLIGNPYLLVGVIERWSFRPQPLPPELEPYLPLLERLSWSLADRTIRCGYNLSSYLKMTDSFAVKRQFSEELTLVGYNARDLGLKYIEIPQDLANNIEVEVPSAPFAIPQMLHAGPSSRYPGRSNNMSPETATLNFRVRALPASCQVRLWRESPSQGQRPDIRCILSFH